MGARANIRCRSRSSFGQGRRIWYGSSPYLRHVHRQFADVSAIHWRVCEALFGSNFWLGRSLLDAFGRVSHLLAGGRRLFYVARREGLASFTDSSRVRPTPSRSLNGVCAFHAVASGIRSSVYSVQLCCESLNNGLVHY